MSARVICQPTLRFDYDPSVSGFGSVSVCGLDRDLYRRCTRAGDLLRLIFRVAVTQGPSPEGDSLPDVSGRYLLLEDELQFIPRFPFERGLKYRASFDARPLGTHPPADPLTLDLEIPAAENAPATTEVTRIFPSSDLLPENLLRFYVCFSNGMQRGFALKKISLRDSHGQPVADALYRPPVELWDKTMRHLTVLLDPGRLKRWVGPNRELGPPLKVGEQYTLEIGSGMIDLYGRSLREPFRKHFRVGKAVRNHISVERWEIQTPATGTRQSLVLIFKNPLDWALLLRAITIRSAHGSVLDGYVVVDECEKRWSFIPDSSWKAGIYQIRIARGLEDVCGNSISGAFDRPLRKDPNLGIEKISLLTFQLI
jgi:hypothetical protein